MGLQALYPWRKSGDIDAFHFLWDKYLKWDISPFYGIGQTQQNGRGVSISKQQSFYAKPISEPNQIGIRTKAAVALKFRYRNFLTR